jgi:hypothetical protein
MRGVIWKIWWLRIEDIHSWFIGFITILPAGLDRAAGSSPPFPALTSPSIALVRWGISL